MIELSPDRKALVLGTALWGWGIDQQSAYRLLDDYVAHGGRLIDCASNYPINQRPEDLGLALQWLESWLGANSAAPVSLIVKIGAVDNLGSAATNLSRPHILQVAEELATRFTTHLGCISVHWDNRSPSSPNAGAIAETVAALAELRVQGLEIGLSGVVAPELYYQAQPELADHWIIQCKENFATQSARRLQQAVFPKARYLAYGINMGGVKATTTEANSSLTLRNLGVPQALTETLTQVLARDHDFRPRPATLNELALLASYANPTLSGVIIGPRRVEQLIETQTYWDALSRTPLSDARHFVDEVIMKQISS